jgi:hypothetical protein
MSIIYKSQFAPPIAFWTLDDSSWSDSSGNGYDLTDVGGVTNSSGVLNNDAVFNGSNMLTYDNFPAIASRPFSASFWVKYTYNYGDHAPGLIGQWGDTSRIQTSGSFSWGLYDDHDYGELNLLFSPQPNGSGFNRMETGLMIGDGQWHHLVLVYDGTDALLYIDGNLVYKNSVGFIPFASSQPLVLGYSNGEGHAMEMDAVGIWNYALNQQQINALYNNGIGTQDPSVSNNSKINLNAQNYSLNLHYKLNSFWNLDDNGSGGLNLAASNNGNKLTNNNGISLGDGKIGGGALFDVDGSLRGTVNTKLPVTISGWFNLNYWPDNFPYWSPIFVLQNSQHAGQNIEDYQIAIGIWNSYYGTYLGTVSCRCNGGIISEYNSSNPLIDQWVHVTLTCDEQANVNLYVNGIKYSGNYAVDQLTGINPHPISQWAGKTFDRIVIGDDIFSPNGWHSGGNTLKVDDIGIWDRILSDLEISKLYNSGDGRQYPLPQELYTYTPPISGLVAFYNFDGDANDSSGNGINLSGSYTQGTGEINGSADFSAGGSLYYNTDLWDIYASPQSYSHSFWYHPNNTTDITTIYGGNFSAMGLYVQQQQDKIWLSLAYSGIDDKSFYSTHKLKTNKWVHIAIVHDCVAKTLSLYINGKFDNFVSYTTLYTPIQYNNYIGFAINGSAMSGGAEYGGTNQFDAVGLWNRTLSIDEIRTLHDHRLQYPFTPLTNKPKILSNYVAPFTPDQISGLYAWYDSSDTATVLNVSTSPASNGEEVYTWLDKSGSGIDLTIQAAGYGTVYAPTLSDYSINNKPAVRFTAIDQFSGSALRGEQTLGSSSFTWFVVFKWRDLHRTYDIDCVFTLGSEFGSGGEMNIGSDDSNYGIFTSANGGTIIGTPILNKPVSVAFNTNKTSLISDFYSNGSKIASKATNTNPVDSPIILGSWIFNSGLIPEYFADADIAEVIIYNTSLSDTDMNKVNRYIRNKYGI